MKIDGIGNIELIKEKRKSFAAIVHPDLRVIIKTPSIAKQWEIDSFIKRKTKWILKQISFFQQFNSSLDKKYECGSSILYLGKQYQLIVEKAPWKNIIKVSKNKIFILSSAPQKIDDINISLKRWLQQRAKVIFDECLKECLKAFPDLPEPVLKIRKLNKRWGSYLKKHEIVLNPELIKASKQSIKYVIFHELCHVYFEQHTDQFYSLLSSKVPEWKKIKDNLELKILRY